MALCATLLGAGAAQADQDHQQNNTQLFPATRQTTVYAVGDDGYFWDVNFGDGVKGWVPSNYLALVVSTPK